MHLLDVDALLVCAELQNQLLQVEESPLVSRVLPHLQRIMCVTTHALSSWSKPFFVPRARSIAVCGLHPIAISDVLYSAPYRLINFNRLLASLYAWECSQQGTIEQSADQDAEYARQAILGIGSTTDSNTLSSRQAAALRACACKCSSVE